MSVKIEKITQLGIVVRDIYEKVKTYQEVYNIGPWEIQDGDKGFEAEAQDLTVRGKRQDFKVSLATAMVGDLQIELIQPLDAFSEYADFLRKHGEGIQHVSVVTDAKQFKQEMQARGVESALYGYVPGVEKFEYFDTMDDIGMMIETHDTDVE